MKHSWINGRAPIHLMSGTPIMHTGGAQPIAQTATSMQSTSFRSETLLRASRRLDWRFLLPDPNLRRVAYFGPERGALVTSLELFSHRLTTFSSKQVGTYHQGHYDVVVASGSPHHELKQAAALVRTGGALYVEAHGLLRPGPWYRGFGIASLLETPRLWHPSAYVRLLQQMGMTHVQAYWFWPNFEECTKILPLGDPQIAQHVAAPNRGRSTKARAKNKIMRLMLRGKWPALALPCFGIVAQRTDTNDDSQRTGTHDNEKSEQIG